MRARFIAIMRHTRIVLVPVIEAWLRVVEVTKLALLALRRQTTIVDVVNPQFVKGSRVTIFATHPQGTPSYLHERLLAKFAERGHAIIVVSHHPRASDLLGPLCAGRWTLMRRRPFGRDIGGYRDALAFAERAADATGTPLERVVFLNDSVFTFGDGEDRIVEHLDRDDLPFAGITENHSVHHHVGSFMLGVSGEAIRSRSVARFWRRYRPISTRRWAIHHGEVGITRALIRAGHHPNVLYDVTAMRKYLARIDIAQVAAIARLMSSELRSPLLMLDDAITCLIATPAAPNGAVRESDARVTQRERHYGLDAGRQIDVLRGEVDHQVASALLSYVFAGSQIHRAAPLLLALGAGIVKRDLVWRATTQPHDVLELLLLGRGESADREEIALRLRQRGHPHSLGVWARLLHEWHFT